MSKDRIELKSSMDLGEQAPSDTDANANASFPSQYTEQDTSYSENILTSIFRQVRREEEKQQQEQQHYDQYQQQQQWKAASQQHNNEIFQLRSLNEDSAYIVNNGGNETKKQKQVQFELKETVISSTFDNSEHVSVLYSDAKSCVVEAPSSKAFEQSTSPFTDKRDKSSFKTNALDSNDADSQSENEDVSHLIPCRNGVNCYFALHGSCKYFHPSSTNSRIHEKSIMSDEMDKPCSLVGQVQSRENPPVDENATLETQSVTIDYTAFKTRDTYVNNDGEHIFKIVTKDKNQGKSKSKSRVTDEGTLTKDEKSNTRTAPLPDRMEMLKQYPDYILCFSDHPVARKSCIYGLECRDLHRNKCFKIHPKCDGEGKSSLISGDKGSSRVEMDTFNDYLYPFQVACVGGNKCPQASSNLPKGKPGRKCLYWHPPNTVLKIVAEYPSKKGLKQMERKRTSSDIDEEISDNELKSSGLDDKKPKAKRRKRNRRGNRNGEDNCYQNDKYYHLRQRICRFAENCRDFQRKVCTKLHPGTTSPLYQDPQTIPCDHGSRCKYFRISGSPHSNKSDDLYHRNHRRDDERRHNTSPICKYSHPPVHKCSTKNILL